MIKKIFTALTGISEDEHESPEAITLWELQRVIDECDISDDEPSDDSDESDEEPRSGWLGLW